MNRSPQAETSRAFHIGIVLSVIKKDLDFCPNGSEAEQRKLVLFMHGREEGSPVSREEYEHMLRACRIELLEKTNRLRDLDTITFKQYSEDQDVFLAIVSKHGVKISVPRIAPR